MVARPTKSPLNRPQSELLLSAPWSTMSAGRRLCRDMISIECVDPPRSICTLFALPRNPPCRPMASKGTPPRCRRRHFPTPAFFSWAHREIYQHTLPDCQAAMTHNPSCNFDTCNVRLPQMTKNKNASALIPDPLQVDSSPCVCE